jgi:hypothetical protein
MEGREITRSTYWREEQKKGMWQRSLLKKLFMEIITV